MGRIASVIVGLAWVWGTAVPARAADDCAEVVTRTFALDLAAVGEDTSPPGAIGSLKVVAVHREDYTEGEGCGGATDCAAMGYVELEVVAPVDDRTPPERIGYRFEGDAGQGGLPDPVTADEQGRIRWYFGEGGDAEPMEVALTVIPLDEAGNEGPGTTVVVEDPGISEGCTQGRLPFPGPLLPVTLLLLALGMRRMLRRA